jgi:integrase
VGKAAKGLTDSTIKAAKPQEKTYQLYDGHGLYIEIAPSGGKWWRLRYRHDGKDGRVSLGTYPDVSLQKAREKAWDMKKRIAEGKPPSARSRRSKKEGTLFEDLALAWWTKFVEPRNAKYAERVLNYLKIAVFPHIGEVEITEISAQRILGILRNYESSGKIVTAHKIKSWISQIFNYSIASGLTYTNPARDLSKALMPVRSVHRSAITDPKEMGRLMQAVFEYSGSVIVSSAIKFQALTFVRPGELRLAEWAEIDIPGKLWRIPAEKMKMKRPHIVPLSKQSLDIIEFLRPITGNSKYLFKQVFGTEKPLDRSTLTNALRLLGYTKNKMCAHGFRASAMTLLAEKGWPIEVIDAQLAHSQGSTVRAAYLRAEYLEKRIEMMSFWANYLDELRESV